MSKVTFYIDKAVAKTIFYIDYFLNVLSAIIIHIDYDTSYISSVFIKIFQSITHYDLSNDYFLTNINLYAYPTHTDNSMVSMVISQLISLWQTTIINIEQDSLMIIQRIIAILSHTDLTRDTMSSIVVAPATIGYNNGGTANNRTIGDNNNKTVGEMMYTEIYNVNEP